MAILAQFVAASNRMSQFFVGSFIIFLCRNCRKSRQILPATVIENSITLVPLHHLCGTKVHIRLVTSAMSPVPLKGTTLRREEAATARGYSPFTCLAWRKGQARNRAVWKARSNATCGNPDCLSPKWGSDRCESGKARDCGFCREF